MWNGHFSGKVLSKGSVMADDVHRMAKPVIIAGILFTVYFGIGTTLYIASPGRMADYN